MPLPNRCQICGEPAVRPLTACTACIRSHIDAGLGNLDGGVPSNVLWAANRARWYAERRTAKNTQAKLDRERKTRR